MDIENFLAEQREKLEQDRNRILSSTFTKEIPKELFQSTKDVDLNANFVEEPISTSAKLSSLATATVPDDNAQEAEKNSDVGMSKDSKNAANEIQLLQVTQDDLVGSEKENNSPRVSSSRRSKVSDSTFYCV